MEEWLKELGVQVSDWEESFQNGYLLGSILFRYGRLDTFGRFVNKPEWLDRNLVLLGNGLDELGVPFAAERLKAKETGYARSVVKQVYSKFCLITQAKDKRRSKTGQVRNKNELIEAKLGKFKEEMKRQEQQALAAHELRTKELQAQQQEERKAHLDALRSNHLFMQQWEAQGRQHWKTNMTKLKAMKDHDMKVKTWVASTFKNSQLRYIQDNAQDQLQGIEEFEKNLIRLGIDYNPEGASGPKKKVNLAAEAAVTMARIREKSHQHEQALREKETRLTKMQFDQERTAKQNSVKQTLSALFKVVAGLIALQTKFAVKRLKKHVSDAKEHAASLPEKEEKRKQREALVSEFRAQQKLHFQKLERELQQSTGDFKYQRRQARLQEMQAKHSKSAQACAPILDTLLELTDAAEELLKDKPQISEQNWQALLRYFVDGPQETPEETSVQVEEEADTGPADLMVRFRPPSP